MPANPISRPPAAKAPPSIWAVIISRSEKVGMLFSLYAFVALGNNTCQPLSQERFIWIRLLCCGSTAGRRIFKASGIMGQETDLPRRGHARAVERRATLGYASRATFTDLSTIAPTKVRATAEGQPMTSVSVKPGLRPRHPPLSPVWHTTFTPRWIGGGCQGGGVWFRPEKSGCDDDQGPHRAPLQV